MTDQAFFVCCKDWVKVIPEECFTFQRQHRDSMHGVKKKVAWQPAAPFASPVLRGVCVGDFQLL